MYKCNVTLLSFVCLLIYLIVYVFVLLLLLYVLIFPLRDNRAELWTCKGCSGMKEPAV